MAVSNQGTVAVRACDPATHGACLRVTSTSFANGSAIPEEFTPDGKNTSPQLSWSGAPAGTRSFAITCFDPDAPTGSGYWHWVVFNIPGTVTSLEPGAGNGATPGGGRQGINDSGGTTYLGPCPPEGHGTHHYTFTVYALDVDTIEGASATTTGATLVFSMRGHVLATGDIMGTFER